MVYEFRLPDLGEGLAEAEIVKWRVKEGDAIKRDQPLVDVLTEKATVEIPSPREGTVLRLMANEGDIVKVGQPLVLIGEKGEAAVEPTPPHAPPKAVEEKKTVEVPAAPAPQAPEATVPVRPREILATPAVRKLARELGVDLSLVKGTGPGGRITEGDVRIFAEARIKPIAPAVPVAIPKPPGLPEERVPLRGIRRKIAEKMVKSKFTAPHVTHVDEVDVTELVELREKAKAMAEKRGVKLTYLPFIIKALIPALKQYPFLNASLDEEKGEIVLKKYYHMGIATATEQGLIVPVVKDADKKSILQLAEEIDELTEKARRGELELEEVRGSTFTITNVGPIGGVFATPIINYPEVAILGVHKITKRPVVRDGDIVVRDMMYVSLSFDHRVIDGAVAAEFVNALKRYLEDPKLLLLEAL